MTRLLFLAPIYPKTKPALYLYDVTSSYPCYSPAMRQSDTIAP